MSGQRFCAVCDAPGPFDAIYELGGFTLVRCPRCGLAFQDPQPTFGEMDDVYYFSEDFARRLETDLRTVTFDSARAKLPLLLEAGAAPGGSALDVGCSSGAWLEVARDAGWDPIGVEIGGALAAAARAKGFEVHEGTLEEAAVGPLWDRRFSLITFWDVLEHLPDPRSALQAAAKLLEPDGAVALTFPNVDGWYPRATHRLIARRTGVWEYAELPVHLFDFSPSTAAALLRRVGLSVAHARTMGVPFSFYRTITLPPQLAAKGRAAGPLRLAFEALRVLIYPAARVFDRGNAQFVLGRPSLRPPP